MGYGNFKTTGMRLIEAAEDMQKSLGQNRRYIFQAKNMFAPSEEKATVDSSSVGYSTPGALGAQRVIDGVLAGPRRRLTIRDILVSKPVTSGQVDWLKENTFTSMASPQTESSLKGESSFSLTVGSTHVSTIAHFATFSRQVLDDLPGLRKYIDESLLYYLRLKEETEILSGDGLGTHLNGLITQATAYAAGTYNVAGDTKLDKLRHYILDLENADEMCTAFVVSPTDMHDIQLLKTEEGGVNKGMYLVGDPNAPGAVLAVNTLWGKPCIVTRSMPAGKALAGDFSKAFLADRQDATIDLSLEHNQNFTSNLATILCEERTTVCVARGGAFRYGSI